MAEPILPKHCFLINQSPENINTTSKDISPVQGKLNKDGADNTPPAHEPILISTETADINSDGYDDILLAYAGTENAPLKLLCGNSLGIYDDLSAVLLPFLDIPAPIMAKSADVNSDGFADIIITSFGKTKIDPYDVKAIDTRKNYVLINSGTGAFTDETVSLFGEDFAYTSGIDIQANDFNGDGQNELVLIKPDGNLLYENANGKFLSSAYYEAVTPQPVQNRTITVDANNNGSQDTIAISNGIPIIIYDNPNALQKPIGLPTLDSGLQTSYISPFQYKVSGPGGKDMAGVRQIGDIIYFEFDSIIAAYVWGNILLNFDTARLKCVSIEEDPNNWHGFWVWWTLATGMPEYGGGGIPYYYDSTGKGSNRARTWASWYGPETAGPVGSYDNELGKIWLYTSTLAGYSYTSPLRIGFEVLQTGPVSFTAQSNDFTAYDFHNVDAGTVSTVNIVQQDNCATNEDLTNNARVRICGPDQVETGERFTINVLGQTINPIYSLGNNVYSVEFSENDALLYRKGFNWGEEHISAYDFTKTIPGSYTYKYRYRDGSKVHAGYDWVQAELTVLVQPPVQIDFVYPDIGCTGNTEQVVINGNGFTQETTVSFGEGIAVNVTDIQPDKITASITPASSAVLGLRPVSAGAATKENAFTVIDIRITGDEYVPVGTEATADLQAQIIPADALSGREISYSWQVFSGAGTLTQTDSFNTSFVPSTVETAEIGFTVYISGTVFTRSTYVKTWDFDFIIRPIQTPAAKTMNKPEPNQQQPQDDIYKDTEIAIAKNQSVEAVIVFKGDLPENNTLVSVMSQKPEIVSVSETAPWILTGLKENDNSVVTANIAEKKDAKTNSKIKQKIIYVIDMNTGTSNQSSSIILPRNQYIYTEMNQSYTVWTTENGIAKPTPAKWTLTAQNLIVNKPKTDVAAFAGESNDVKTITIDGQHAGTFVLKAIPGKNGIETSLIITVFEIEITDILSKPDNVFAINNEYTSNGKYWTEVFKNWKNNYIGLITPKIPKAQYYWERTEGSEPGENWKTFVPAKQLTSTNINDEFQEITTGEFRTRLAVQIGETAYVSAPKAVKVTDTIVEKFEVVAKGEYERQNNTTFINVPKDEAIFFNCMVKTDPGFGYTFLHQGLIQGIKLKRYYVYFEATGEIKWKEWGHQVTYPKWLKFDVTDAPLVNDARKDETLYAGNNPEVLNKLFSQYDTPLFLLANGDTVDVAYGTNKQEKTPASALVSYKLKDKILFDAEFTTWLVVFNTTTQQYVPLKQQNWTLVIDTTLNNGTTSWKCNVLGLPADASTKPTDKTTTIDTYIQNQQESPEWETVIRK